MRQKTVWSAVALAALTLSANDTLSRELTFEQRVQAQQAIEQVYYAYQTGTRRTFDEAVPRAVLEAKVRRYLGQTVALEHFWSTPLSPEALQRETERIAAETRLPERLRELYRALGDDAFLFQECVARATLVDRRTRHLLAHDERVQGVARTEAEALRAGLLDGTLDPSVAHPRRSILEVALPRRTNDDADGRDPTMWAEPAEDGATPRLELPAEEFRRWRARAPERVGAIGKLEEDGGSFVVRTVLEETERSFRLAVFSVPKTSWDSWWARNEPSFDAGRVRPVASTTATLPAPGNTADCRNGSARSSTEECVDGWAYSGLAIPEPRVDFTTVWTGREMIVFGGLLGSLRLGTGARYDPLTDSWAPVSGTGGPGRRRGHTAVWTGDEMIVWGGETLRTFPPEVSILRSGARYDPVSDTWSRMRLAPAASDEHAAVWIGTEMLVIGVGPDGAARYDPAADTWTTVSTAGAPVTNRTRNVVWTGSEVLVWRGIGSRYDPLADTWTTISDVDAPPGGFGSSAVWTGTEMLVWGGLAAGPTPGGRYDPSTDTWRGLPLAGAPAARREHLAVWTGEHMVVWGGERADGTLLDTGGRYDPGTETWSPTARLDAPSARERTGPAIWTGREMIVWGGAEDSQTFLASGGRYDSAADVWKPIVAPPSPRADHTAVWTGNRMIVWGGSVAGGSGFDTGGIYDPLLQSWSPTTTVGAPSRRSSHAAVWTGDEMIVWGGFPELGTAGTGGRYDPVRDAWTPTSTVGAPFRRAGHTAVWTGDRMIVWGGTIGFVFNDGALYDPVADTWTPTSLQDAPRPRWHHTAVWTGEEMIVWSGVPAPFWTDTGGRYDPRTDSWRPTSTEGAPTGRIDHTAVWTGSEMIVWGGLERVGIRPTGGRYDPLADTWAPTSVIDAPVPRELHAAVWTGREMVIWGGRSGREFSTNGGRYDPATDTWLPTATLGAPRGRERHTAVWTGSSMLVWGGFDGQRTVFGPLTFAGSGSAWVPDGDPPEGSIVEPAEGACLGGQAVPVVVLDDFRDGCDDDPARSYDPPPGPFYDDHGDETVVLTVTDFSNNSASDSVSFTIDTVSPEVSLGSAPDLVTPAVLPLADVFTASDADGAAGGVVREVLKLAGCTVYDGLSYGNADGRLVDESIPAGPEELCRIWTACGFDGALERPELRVEATDCGDNVGVATRTLEGTIGLVSGACE